MLDDFAALDKFIRFFSFVNAEFAISFVLCNIE